MNKLLTMSFLPRSADLGLLLLRVMAGFSYFLNHGVEKVANFSGMAAHFPNPVGIGPVATLAMALIADAICSILLILGFAARWAALYIAIVLGTAFFVVHGARLQGPHNGEMPYLYATVALTILLAGPGRFSIDGRKGKL